MKAIQIHKYGELGDLSPRDVEAPGPMAGEVVVKVSHAAINPSDIKNFQGSMSHTKLPRIVGRDFAGTIVEGPKNRIGEKVWGTGGELGFERDGAYAEFMRIPERAAVPLPKGMDPAQAATLGVPFVTAMSVLDCFGQSIGRNIQPDIKKDIKQDIQGKALLNVGGTGAVGTATTMIARARGVDVIRTTRAEKEVQALPPSLREGKFIYLDKTPDIKTAAMELTKGEGVDFAVNAVGGQTFEPTLESLKKFGKLVTISSVPDHRVSFNLLQFYRKQQTHYGVNTLLLDSIQCGEILKRMIEEIGSQLPPLGSVELRPFKDAKSAFEDLMNGKARKIVLEMPG